MTDLDMFDRALSRALRDFATEAPTLDDPAAFARAVVSRHPRRSAAATFVQALGGRRLAWIVIGALLGLAALAAVAGLGARLAPDQPALPVPDELFGSWRASVREPVEAGPPAGEYGLNFGAASLLTAPGERPVEWAGRAIAIARDPTGGLELLVAATGACGSGRYAIVADVGGEPAPGPSASGGNPTAVPSRSVLERLSQGEAMRILPIADACADRVAILTSGPWQRPTVDLTPNQPYDSLDFTEPFRFAMPATDPGVPGAVSRPWGKGILRVGNGYSWTSFFLDDVRVARGVCDAAGGMLADIPTTPKAVGSWLRNSGLTVSGETEIVVDGRTALSFSINGDGCGTWSPPLEPGEFYFGFRVYAIPTPDDTILLSVWSDEGSLDDISTAADDLVRSITFEQP